MVVPVGDSVVVVHGVLRPDLPDEFGGRQYIVVARSLTGLLNPYNMMVAVTDANYYDFSRSHDHKYTRRGFLNRLNGGSEYSGALPPDPFRYESSAKWTTNVRACIGFGALWRGCRSMRT